MTSPRAEDGGSMRMQQSDNWPPTDDHTMGSRGDVDPLNGVSGSTDGSRAGQSAQNPDYPRSSSVDVSISGSKTDANYREKQVKPNKVYVGGLPEHTRQEDLESCFGKIGNITNVELKVGYGFVEFDSREAAEESVAKYNEGFFMGNKIRVELSRGGGRTAKYSNDPGACFKCGKMGHWARECPHHPQGNSRRSHHHGPYDAPLIDRIQPSSSRQYPQPPSREYPSYRDDLGPSRYTKETRYEYPPPPPGREPRRAITPPPREYRDYSAGSPVVRPPRDFDRDYRVRGPPPPHRYEAHPGYYPPESEGPPRGYPPPPQQRDIYDRYDKRLPPGNDRYAYTYPPSSARPRTPPGGPPARVRDDFDRPLSHREFPPPEYRGRPVSPPLARYAPDFQPRSGTPDMSVLKYRRRSGSPPPRYEPSGYSGGFAGNGYSSNVLSNSGSGPPPRASGSRDHSFRNNRDEPGGNYRRP